MKKVFLYILIFAVLFSVSIAQEYRIEYFINDYYGLLSEEQAAAIEPVLKEVYDSGKAEYAVIIIQSLNGSDIEGLSYKLAEGNLGDKKKNNGLLLLVAMEERQYRFEVGRDLEPELPDVIVSRIGRYYLEPRFKEGDYAGGIYDASVVIKDILLNITGDPNIIVPQQDNSEVIAAIIALIIILFVFSAIVYLSLKQSKRGLSRTNDDYFAASTILSELLFRGGRGGFGGSGGGGFGGFGGGSFGGGGAGGHW